MIVMIARQFDEETVTATPRATPKQAQIRSRMFSVSVGICIFFFGSMLLSTWIAGALWARSTWSKRRTSLHVRVRMPGLVLADIVLDVMAITFICLEQIFSYNHLIMPCILMNGVSALGIVLSRGIVLRRVVMLYMAFATSQPVNRNGLQLAKVKRLGARVYTMWSIVGACAVIVAILPFRLCSSNLCHSKCTWNAQYLLLMPLWLMAEACIFIAQSLLARTGSVDRVGIVEEIRRSLFFPGALRGVAFAIVVLMDKGILENGEPWLTVNAACWLSVYIANFVTMHVLPSFTYGYAPRWRRSRRRVVPNAMTAFSAHLAALDAMLAARVDIMINGSRTRQGNPPSSEAKPLEHGEFKPKLSGDTPNIVENGIHNPKTDPMASDAVEGGALGANDVLGRRSTTHMAVWSDADLEHSSRPSDWGRPSDMAPWSLSGNNHFSHVRDSSVDHGNMKRFRASDVSTEKGQTARSDDLELLDDDLELFDQARVVLEDILSDQALLEEFLSFCKSMLSDDLAYFLCLVRTMLLPQYHAAASNQHERDQAATAPISIDDLRLLYHTFLYQRSVHAIPLSRNISKALDKRCKALFKTTQQTPPARQSRSSSITATIPMIQRTSFLGTIRERLSISSPTSRADVTGDIEVLGPSGVKPPSPSRDGQGSHLIPGETQAQQQPRLPLHPAPSPRWSRDLLHTSSGRRRSLTFLVARLFQPRDHQSIPETNDQNLGAEPPLLAHTSPALDATKGSSDNLSDEQQEHLNEVARLLRFAYREVEMVILLQVLGPFASYMITERPQLGSSAVNEAQSKPLRSITLDHMGMPSEAMTRSSSARAQHLSLSGRTSMDYYMERGSGSSSPSRRSSSVEPTKTSSDNSRNTWLERTTDASRISSSSPPSSSNESRPAGQGRRAWPDGERNKGSFAGQLTSDIV